ncbi:MAG: hypothetical protein K6A33_06195 [Clostridiales bacterium]|nr:hypothetical protein [Clostridiales bacterium]
MADDERREKTPEEAYESNAARRLRAEAREEAEEPVDTIHEGEAATGSRLANFWYHHKWKVIIGTFFAFVILVGVSQYASRSNPDATLIYAGPSYITPTGNRAFCSILEGMADDFNGDGKTYVQLNDVVYYTETQLADYAKFCEENDLDMTVDRLANARTSERFTYQVMGGEAPICILSPAQYDLVASSGGFMKLTDVFGEVPEDVAAAAVDEYGVRFAETKFCRFYDAAKIFPDDAILAMRTLPTLSALTGKRRAEAIHGQNLTLFRAMLSFEFPEGFVEGAQEP